MKIFQEVILCAIILGTFYACASTVEETNSLETSNLASIKELEKIPTVEEGKNGGKLAKSKKMMISIEGMEEEINVKLYKSDSDIALPFQVYIPSNYTASREKVNENDAVVFASGPAKLKLIFLPPEVDEDDAKGIAKDLVRARGNMRRNETEEEKIYYLADEDKEVYTTEVRDVNGKYFILASEIPVAYVDGFYPRAELISENILWNK